MDAKTLHTTLGELDDAGLLQGGPAPLPAERLHGLAQRSAALAIAAHRHALCSWLLHQLPTLSRPVNADDVGIALWCAEAWPPRWLPNTTAPFAKALLWTPPHWQHLIVPTWHEGRWEWAVLAHEQVQVHATPEGALLGPPGLDCCMVSAPVPLLRSTCSRLSTDHAARVMHTVRHIERSGLRAIAHGLRTVTGSQGASGHGANTQAAARWCGHLLAMAECLSLNPA